MNLYDYIYVDLDKVISLYSQMTGGVVEVIERNAETSRSSHNKRNYDFKVFKHDAGGTEIDKRTSRETIKPHHALLKEMEDALGAEGYLVDLTDSETANSFHDPAFRAQLKDTFCIKVRGRAVIEDYERMKGIAIAFPDIAKLINKSGESTLLNSPEYVELKAQLTAAEAATKGIKDRNARASEVERLKKTKDALATLVATSTSVDGVDQWILDGMRTWIDTFLPGIVNLRVYPSADRPDEHVFGHLKKSCFEDTDASSFHFTYGSFPTESLTLVGIVTSVPSSEGEQFKPLGEFEKPGLADHESVERGFRGLFRGFDGLEQMIRTCRYPRVLVHPLTVYRSVAPNPSFKRTPDGAA
ncbi:hypothetical protein LOF27_08865 [Xanthomonas euvesicatoria]|uniref:DUF6414 family protein n=1 Tax=Xanthomonas euvesicatoria TaxID=456327 RepID=UPI002406710D|nr:hypothetical protein [Xanthomonas euvesicatoria]MCC8913488.1 hypothetical protein [Xanthomonas euvesicatoria]